jgi:EAL domain-containing protein (putative c-di-GMP-specific phosphodiesterase class I)
MVKPVVLAELVARVEAQVRMSVTWQSTLQTLSRRAETVAALAEPSSTSGPTMTAAILCERISRAHDGAPVAVYESRSDGTQIPLASIGAQPRFLSTAAGRPSMRLRQQVRGSAWVEHERARTAMGEGGIWWVCAPLRRGATTLGVLVIGGRPAPNDVGAVDRLLAAAVDYAAVAALHLGPGLTDASSLRDKRDALRRTLRERAFWPVFQPILRLRSGGLIGYEALTRFADGVPPDQRLADASEVGLAADMEIAMLSVAIQSSDALVDSIWLSVNVSPAVLIERNEELVRIMSDSPRPLVVELTEHSPIDDYAVARAALAKLGSQVRLSVDDAGAGFASMRHVLDLHPHFLKLDRSWVAGIDKDEARQALVAGLVGFSARTTTDIIAEGIETPDEKVTLEQLGVPYGQGYLLGRPQPVANIDAYNSDPACGQITS